jgi:hypothetical protein
MKLSPTKTAFRILAVLVLVGAGVMIERLSREPEEVDKNAPRYKASVRVVKENAGIAEAPERIKAARAPELLQSVVKALDLASRWHTESAAASAKLSGMIEAHVETTSPEVLVVTVRSMDKKEPDEIAGALVKAMTRRAPPGRDTLTDTAQAQEFAPSGVEEIAKQTAVLEDARAKIAAILLGSMRERPTQKYVEIRNRIGAVKQTLRVINDRNNGRDPAIALSEDERAEFTRAVTKLKEVAGGELNARDLETLALVNATAEEGPELQARRQELQSRLESRLRQSQQELEEESVAPDSREAYAKARQEYDTELRRLKLMQEQTTRSLGGGDAAP